MMFQVKIISMCWIDDSEDDPDDLCLHGNVRITIGDECLESPGTVSALVLRLLKTLTEDHLIPNMQEQMLPCCGHFLIPNDALDNVTITGCGYGTDWLVQHKEGKIKLTTESGQITLIDHDAYQNEVFRIADEVERYYQNCKPKIPRDDFSRDGYTAFWNEWHRRRGSK